MSREGFNLQINIDPSFRESIFARLRERSNMMASSTSTATPIKHIFDERSSDVKSPKNDINSLILDYLTMAGYPKAAAKFSKEANLQPQQDSESIRARQEIQQAIHTGYIEEAISGLNQLDPEILDKDPKLHFSLLRLQLVELIRQCDGGDITAALQFASEQLAPRAATNRDFLKDLEKTMALLIFPHDQLQPELASLLHSDLRRETAENVNDAVLRQETDRREAAIRSLVKMRAWAESSARTGKKDLPGHIDLGLNGEDPEGRDEFDNGHEPMITN